jgi:hypothetical protein
MKGSNMIAESNKKLDVMMLDEFQYAPLLQQAGYIVHMGGGAIPQERC